MFFVWGYGFFSLVLSNKKEHIFEIENAQKFTDYVAYKYQCFLSEIKGVPFQNNNGYGSFEKLKPFFLKVVFLLMRTAG